MKRKPHKNLRLKPNRDKPEPVLDESDIRDEESISGSETAPEADDDTLANAQAVGQQLGEDEEHPKEIDLARDIDKAERYHRTH